MFPDFALHHLPLYAVTLAAVAGLGFWGWVRVTLARQTAEERRDAIASRALASARAPALPLDELANEEPVHVRSMGRRQVR